MYNVLLRNLLHLFLAMLQGAPRRRHNANLAVHACNRICYNDLNSELFIKSMQVLRMRSSGDVELCLHNPCLSLFRFVSSPERSEFNGKTGSDRN